MNRIPQFGDLFNQFTQINKSLFVIQYKLQPLELFDLVPNKINALLTNPLLIKTIEELSKNLELLTPLVNEIAQETQKILASKKIFKSNKKKSMQEYASFIVDNLEPIISSEKPKDTSKTENSKSFKEIMEERASEGKKPIKPINKRSNSLCPCNCPKCNATPDYIYDNNKLGQWLCKVCETTFNVKTTKSKNITLYCPYCKTALDKHHERNCYDVFYCPNHDCDFYKKNKKKEGTSEYEELKTNTNRYKLRYTYRSFHIDFDKDIKNEDLKFKSKVNLKRIQSSDTILGLVLTYRINYGLSSRKVSNIMWDVHNVKISHQTVQNYCEAVVPYVQGLVDKYPYELSDKICGDETYVECKGKHKYVFFFSDVVKKTILSYRIFDNRDTTNAIKSLYMALSKYKSLPDNLEVVTDANPIYNAAQLYFKMTGIDFCLHQVIGVSNKNEESKKYRPFKQVEERLNRTFKENYNGMNGFDNIRSANIYMILYVSFFNFLRRHSSLEYNPPVKLDIFDSCDNMMSKWIKLINYGSNYVYN